jgi:hypothetical protein
MAIITLLDLPIELPADCEARQAGLENLTDGLAQYMSRCKKNRPLCPLLILIPCLAYRSNI